MNKNQTAWTIPAAGVLLFATSVLADQETEVYLDATNRVSVSLRTGFNISGGFRGIGSTFAPGTPFANHPLTPNGDKYNYDDGYVLPDATGSKDGYTWYWGYNSASQVNPANDTIAFHNTTAAGQPGEDTADHSPYAGMEISDNYQIFKDDWRHLYYGLEFAANWTPISFGADPTYGLVLNQTTTTYGYTPGTTPPGYSSPGELPYQGGFQGPGFSLNYPSVGSSTSISHAALFVHQNFDANLWGFRLGPSVDFMPSPRWDIHLSAGGAMGIASASASWKETLVFPGGPPTTVSASGDDVGFLGGFYVEVDGEYKFTEHWSAFVGVQFQDMDNYSHNFGGRTAELNLDQSVFLDAGVSFSF